MKYRKLTDINQEMTASENALQQADQAFLGELQKVAESIWQTAAERPVILLAGPSGSGKTTTAFCWNGFWIAGVWKRIRFPWTISFPL